MLRGMRRDSMWSQVVVQVGGRGLMLGLHLLLPVLLGWGAYGELMAVWVWIFLIAQPLCDLGLDPLVTRDVSRGNWRTAGHAGMLRSGAMVFALAVSLGLGAWVGLDLWLTVLLVGWAGINAVAQVGFAALRGIERMPLEAVAVVAARGLLVGAIVALWWWGWLEPIIVASALVVGAGLAALLGSVTLGQSGYRVQLQVIAAGMGSTAVTALPLAIVMAAGMLYLRVDGVMLERMTSSDELGWYQPAVRLIEAAFVLPSILTIAVFPSLSRRAAAASPEVLRGLPWMVLGGAAAGVLVALCGSGAFYWLYPGQYAAVSLNLAILSLAVPLVFGGTLTTQYLIAADRVGVYACMGVAALGLNVALNYLLIPIFGGPGAAAATVATEGFVLVASAGLVAMLARQVAGGAAHRHEAI